jgi:hypothetical protein
VERALVDLWQADAEGVYDNTGFRLRGHQFTDAEGRYRFLTIMPASYEGRTRHVHVKVQAPGGRVLTTQLYFPGEAHNRSDRLFRRELLMNVTEAEGSLAARFDFVLDVRWRPMGDSRALPGWQQKFSRSSHRFDGSIQRMVRTGSRTLVIPVLGGHSINISECAFPTCTREDETRSR